MNIVWYSLAILLFFPNLIGATTAKLQETLPEFIGQFTQGGMIIGKTAPGDQVKLNDQRLKVSENGNFVFGFGRDAALQQVITVIKPNGSQSTKTFDLTKRQYQEDRLTVDQKYVAPDKSVLKRIRDDNRRVAAARSVMTNRQDFLMTMILPAQGRISGVYGSRRILNDVPKRPHYGLDIAAPVGTQVIAPISGKVVLAEEDMYYTGGTLILEHGFGITTTYIHLSKLLVKKGQYVTQGEKIAEIGATGRVTGPHLDWRLNWGKVRLDPQLMVNESLDN